MMSSGMIPPRLSRRGFVSDLKIVNAEPTPDPVCTIPARVADLIWLAPDVVGVGLESSSSHSGILPGQYCKLQFRGFRGAML